MLCLTSALSVQLKGLRDHPGAEAMLRDQLQLCDAARHILLLADGNWFCPKPDRSPAKGGSSYILLLASLILSRPTWASLPALADV